LKQLKFGGNHAGIIDARWAMVGNKWSARATRSPAEKEHSGYRKYTIWMEFLWIFMRKAPPITSGRKVNANGL